MFPRPIIRRYETRKKNMCLIFLLIIMQRMVTSSTAAIKQSLERRLEILKNQATRVGSLTEEDLDDLNIEDGLEGKPLKPSPSI